MISIFGVLQENKLLKFIHFAYKMPLILIWAKFIR